MSAQALASWHMLAVSRGIARFLYQKTQVKYLM
jgi:hypothetical protein